MDNPSGKLQKYLDKDHFLYGIFLGILLPLVLFGLLSVVEALAINVFHVEQLMKRSTMILVSIFINLFSMRFFLVNKKSDKTGRGILMATFALALVFFYFLVDG